MRDKCIMGHLEVAGHIGLAAEPVIEAKVRQWWGDRLVPVPESVLAGRRLSTEWGLGLYYSSCGGIEFRLFNYSTLTGFA
jgi:hypothetical protein